jgi:hypothetical protein
MRVFIGVSARALWILLLEVSNTKSVCVDMCKDVVHCIFNWILKFGENELTFHFSDFSLFSLAWNLKDTCTNMRFDRLTLELVKW